MNGQTEQAVPLVGAGSVAHKPMDEGNGRFADRVNDLARPKISPAHFIRSGYRSQKRIRLKKLKLNREAIAEQIDGGIVRFVGAAAYSVT